MLETLPRLDDPAAWDNWTKRREEASARCLSALRYRRRLARRPHDDQPALTTYDNGGRLAMPSTEIENYEPAYEGWSMVIGPLFV